MPLAITTSCRFALANDLFNFLVVVCGLLTDQRVGTERIAFQIAHGIDKATKALNSKMQMSFRAVPGATDLANLLAVVHLRAGKDVGRDRKHVVVVRLETIVVTDHDEISARSLLARAQDGAGAGGKDLSALRDFKVDTFMGLLATLDGMEAARIKQA